MDKVASMWDNSIKAGDTVHLERGSVWIWKPASAEPYLHTDIGGNSSAPMVIRGDDYGSLGASKPIIKRDTSNRTNATFYSITKGGWVTLRDFIVDGGCDGSNSACFNNTVGVAGIDISQNTYWGHQSGEIRNVTIKNLVLRNLGKGGTTYSGGVGVLPKNDSNIYDVLIEGNDVSGYSGHGLNHYPEHATMYGRHRQGEVYNTIWRNNWVHDPSSTRFPDVGTAMHYSTGGSGNIIEGNTFEGSQPMGTLFFDVFTGTDSGVTIRNNIIKDNPTGSGISIYGTEEEATLNAKIYNNIVSNVKYAGFNFQAVNFPIYGEISFFNNTLVNNAYYSDDTSTINITGSKGRNTVNIFNNILYKNAGIDYSIRISEDYPGVINHGNNLYFDTRGNSRTVIQDYKNKKSFSLASIKDYESSAINYNPQFSNINLIPSGLQLTSISPAINAGKDMGPSYSSDYSGTSRVNWDIGAYEYSGTPPATFCTLDTWQYSEWSSCTNGVKARTATKTFDCATADTPAESILRYCSYVRTAPELISWYKLNENSGNIAGDSSGKNNNGNIFSADWTTGHSGNGLQFNGNSGYVHLSTKDMKLEKGTVTLWGMVNDFGQKYYSGAFFMHNSDESWSDKIHIYPEEGKLKIGLGESHELSAVPMDLNKWYHIALTWENGNYFVYLNGIKSAQGTYTGLTKLNSFADIGNTGNPSSRSWSLNGKVDDVRIYNGALNAAEITSVYNESDTPVTPSCSADTWSYSDWSVCSSNGTQTRTATKTFDCATVDTPSLSTVNSCTAPVITPSCSTDTWSYSNWSTCSSNGTQTRTATKTFDCATANTPSLSTTNSCVAPVITPTCSSDTWTYGEWTICSSSGTQTRTATKIYDCPSIDTTSEVVIRSCVPLTQSINISNTQNTYSVNISGNNGSVSKYPNKTSYIQNESVLILALPNTGYYFSNWSGDATGSTNPLTISVSSNKNIQANFTSYSSGNPTNITNPVIITQTPLPGSRKLITASLYLGINHPEVILLQQILNKHVDTVLISKTGAGLPGKETTYFGNVTDDAVKRFQRKYNIAFPGDPGYGMVGPKTRGRLNMI
jgi:hypothetical protein